MFVNFHILGLHIDMSISVDCYNMQLFHRQKLLYIGLVLLVEKTPKTCVGFPCLSNKKSPIFISSTLLKPLKAVGIIVLFGIAFPCPLGAE